MNDLLEIEERTVIEAFTKGDGLKNVVNDVKDLIDNFEHDLTTAAGRKRTASLSHKVSKMKSRLDGMGKELVADWKQKAKAVDANRKKMRDELDLLRDQARQPLTDWENAEKERIENHHRNLEYIAQTAWIDDESTSEEIKQKIDTLKNIVIDDSYDEFEEQANKSRTSLIESLETAYKRELKAEKEREELERLRKEAEEQKIKQEQERKEREEKERQERLVREAEEKARKEAAEEKARVEREKIAAEEREKLQKERAEQAERQRLEAIERAKIEAEQAEQRRIEAEKIAKQKAAEAAERARLEEIQRQKAEEERIKKEQEKREADLKHVSNIRRESKEDLMSIGCDEELAKKIVLAICKNRVRNIELKY